MGLEGLGGHTGNTDCSTNFRNCSVASSRLPPGNAPICLRLNYLFFARLALDYERPMELLRKCLVTMDMAPAILCGVAGAEPFNLFDFFVNCVCL